MLVVGSVGIIDFNGVTKNRKAWTSVQVNYCADNAVMRTTS